MPYWIVEGTSHETGESETLTLEATCKAHAEVLALKRGLKIDAVRPEDPVEDDGSILGPINFTDPTSPVVTSELQEAVELAEPAFVLPHWVTCRRCKQAKVVGGLLLLAGMAAYIAHLPHEIYAFAAVIGLLLLVGGWAARRFNLVRTIAIAQV